MWRLLSIKCLCNHMTTLLTCSMSRTLLLPFWDVFEYQFFCLTIFCWCPNLAGLGPTLLKVQIFEKSAKNPTLINFISNDFSLKSNLWVISPQKSAISFKLFSNRSPKPKEIYPISKNCNLKKNGSRAIYLLYRKRSISIFSGSTVVLLILGRRV